MKYIPEEQLRKICDEIDGTYGLYVSIPELGERLELHTDRVFNSASTIKIPIMALLLKDFEEGRLDPAKKQRLAEENRVIGSGVLRLMSPDVELSLYDYSVLMMILSDNAATNHVIDALGIDRVNAFIEQNGWNFTHLACKMFFPKPVLSDGTADFDRTTAGDLGRMLEMALEGKLVSETVSKTLLQIMAAQQVGKFDKGVPVKKHSDPTQPLPPVPEGKVIVANKGGTLVGKVLHDAAVMFFPDGKSVVMTLMTATPDNTKTMEIFKRVSRAIYDSMI